MKFRVLAGAVVAAALQLVFLWSFLGALHAPRPQGLPLGVVAPSADQVADRLEAGSQGAIRPVVQEDRAALLHSIDAREVYGGLVAEPDGSLRLVVADAPDADVAEVITSLSQRYAAERGAELAVEHVRPLEPDDTQGLSALYLSLSWVFGGYFCAVATGMTGGMTYPNARRAALIVLLFAGYAVVVGVLGATVAGALAGVSDGHFAALASAGALLVFAVATATAGLQAHLRAAGTLLALAAFIFVGNPSSGGIVPMEFLPGFWQTVGPWLPNAAGFTTIQNIVYFEGNAVGEASMLLAAYVLAGVGLIVAAGARTARIRRVPVPASVQGSLYGQQSSQANRVRE
jgi:hypothetical protein